MLVKLIRVKYFQSCLTSLTDSCAWFLTAAFLMAAIIQITAAVKLLNATQIVRF